MIAHNANDAHNIPDGADTQDAHAAHQVIETQQECFLCAFGPEHPCHAMRLEGRIVAAYERTIDGERTSIVLLDTGTARVEVRLSDQYYRGLIGALTAHNEIISNHRLTLRIYHLPTAPRERDYNGVTRRIYTASSYTLAVLEPDILLNITDLSQAQYCLRQDTLRRLSPSGATAATIRGNLVHYCFKELLKEHAHGRLNSTPLESLQRHLEEALHLNSLDLALAGVSADAMRAEVAQHLASLANWYESESNTLWDMPASSGEELATDGENGSAPQSRNQVRAETLLLAPEIGLRGRLDLFWQQSDRQRLLELKTGGSSGELPKREHRWQVYGYHALLAVRRDSKMKKALATLLYSGTPGSSQALAIRATIRDLQRVNESRNLLVLSRITDIPAKPPGPSRCTRCSLLTQCQTVSSLLKWEPPQLDTALASPTQRQPAQPDSTQLPEHADAAEPDADQPQFYNAGAHPPSLDIAGDPTFFPHYYQLLQIEGRASEQQLALLWKTPVAQRIEAGSAISGLKPVGPPVVSSDGWEQTYRCTNTSELRAGDEILLSNGDPITGEVVQGTIMQISSEEVTVWTREALEHPTLIDRYDNDLVHVRTQQNLLRWLQVHPHLRDLVERNVRPRFIEQDVPARPDFNMEQNLAVERALEMQDYLLIHGPPGTGKTSVIAEIVRRLCERGQRVLLAAFTNQAVDNMLKRLDKEGFHDYLRLGHERSVDDATIRQHLLKELAAAPAAPSVDDPQTAHNDAQPFHDPDRVRTLLHTMPVVASTTATWSSDKYTSQPAQDEADSADSAPSPDMRFDVAIIDEAGQLTVPAILGALRFARRFILVGDEQQLPPLVLSGEAAQRGPDDTPGLAASLFSLLKRKDDDYTKDHPLAVSACVPLRVQYRMNRWISNFSSTVFYEKQLTAHRSIANRRLVFPRPLPKRAASWEVAAIKKAIEPTLPLIFLDVRDEPAGGTSAETKTSDAEARAVRELVAALLARGIEERDIGIIAPYRAQVANIRRHLFSPAPGWMALSPHSPLSVDTVDRFQGGERAVIIISFATSREPQGQRRDFLINPNRLNVALTRAQCKLILVGCAPALEPLPIFNRLFTYCRSMETLLPYNEAGYQRNLAATT
jgi:DNA replication ATP-dependent helicase Dna2